MGFGTSGEVFFRNDARTAESIQKPTVRLPQGRAFRAPNSNSKLNKRMDNNAAVDASSTANGDAGDDANRRKENLDASEVLYSRRNNRQKEKDVNNNGKNDGKEIQETAETNNANGHKGYSYPVPESGYRYLPPQQAYNYPKENLKASNNGKTEKLKKPNNGGFLNEPQPFNTRPTEKPTEMYVSTVASLEITRNSAANKVGKSLEQTSTPTATTARPLAKTTSSPATQVTRQRGSTTYASSLRAAAESEAVRSRVQSNANSLVNNINLKSSTPSYDSQKINTYTTARKPNGGKTKETPFYTPTIPTVRDTQTTTTASFSTTTPPSTVSSTLAPETSTIPTNSEIVKHALEMMESLKELDMEDVIPTEAERYMGQRLGLEVPPSSGPNALHSLALYFANGDVNNTKRMTQLANGLTSVFLSNKTITKYESLFPDERKSTESPVTRRPVTTTTNKYQNDLDNDLETQHSKHPILSAAGTPQLREIAQVFTHALSAYLQDPEQFRKILSEIRPTEPPNVEFNEIPRFPGEKGFVRQESAYNVPRQAGNSQKQEDLEIFEYSDVTVPSRVRDEDETTTIDDLITTTEANIFTTIYPETLPPASSKLADKTPASRLLSENLERGAANSRVVKQFDEKLRLPAGEINRNLDSFNQRYKFDVNNNDDDDESDDASYFPEDRGNKSILAPYGFGVKPENSTPINDPYPTSLADTQAIPLQWGEDLTTVNPSIEFNAYPTVFSDLLPPFDINGTEVFSIPNVPSNGLELPNEETDEHLQHAQSQSIVASRNTNNIYSEEKKSKTYNDYNINYKNEEEILFGTTNFGERITTEIPQTTTTQKIRGHFVTKAPSTTTTEAPETTTTYDETTEYYKTTLPDSGIINADSKTTLSYTVFLDPLTINDGLMESLESSVTPSPNTYLPRNELTSTEEIETDQTHLTTHTATHRRGKSSFATTPLTIRFNDDESNQNSIEPMQKRANEMFGNLNETQVNHLMNVMKKADENKTVRRLILLLIQTCDGDDHNKTLEASRTALLNALIGMDETVAEERNEIKIVSNRREKSVRATTLPSVPITTYKSPEHERYTSSETVSKELDDSEATALPLEETTFYGRLTQNNDFTTQDYHYSTTDQEFFTTTEIPITTTTTQQPPTTTTIASKAFESNKLVNSKPRFRLKSNSESIRHQKSLGTHEEYQSEASTSLESKKVDARALELLRSLYSLASRWGKKK